MLEVGAADDHRVREVAVDGRRVAAVAADSCTVVVAGNRRLQEVAVDSSRMPAAFSAPPNPCKQG